MLRLENTRKLSKKGLYSNIIFLITLFLKGKLTEYLTEMHHENPSIPTIVRGKTDNTRGFTEEDNPSS